LDGAKHKFLLVPADQVQSGLASCPEPLDKLSRVSVVENSGIFQAEFRKGM
jgi:hypothetical protein